MRAIACVRAHANKSMSTSACVRAHAGKACLWVLVRMATTGVVRASAPRKRMQSRAHEWRARGHTSERTRESAHEGAH
eukprot:6186518-Pleurochrysis_carterae.AAC.2